MSVFAEYQKIALNDSNSTPSNTTDIARDAAVVRSEYEELVQKNRRKADFVALESITIATVCSILLIAMMFYVLNVGAGYLVEANVSEAWLNVYAVMGVLGLGGWVVIVVMFETCQVDRVAAATKAKHKAEEQKLQDELEAALTDR